MTRCPCGQYPDVCRRYGHASTPTGRHQPMRELTDAQAYDLLLPVWATAVVAQHTPQDIDGGPTCDERGCMICNGDDDVAADIVRMIRDGDDGRAPDLVEMIDQVEDYLHELRHRRPGTQPGRVDRRRIQRPEHLNRPPSTT